MDDRTQHPSPRDHGAGADGPGGPPRAAPRSRLSPLNRRRWQNFKAQPARLLVVVDFHWSCSCSRCSPSSSPTTSRSIVSYEGKSYFPVFVNYPETTFGGDFETAADYRDPYLQKLIADKGGYHDLAADPLLLQHPQSRSADAGALEADLAADRSAMQGGGRAQGALQAAATSNTTGSAPTTRAATSWRASSTAFASRCCSA